MDSKHVGDYEAARMFLLGEYKRKIKLIRAEYDDEEFSLIEGDYNHPYYQRIRDVAEERDTALANLKAEYDNKV